jgi:hypothetical protein
LYKFNGGSAPVPEVEDWVDDRRSFAGALLAIGGAGAVPPPTLDCFHLDIFEPTDLDLRKAI